MSLDLCKTLLKNRLLLLGRVWCDLHVHTALTRLDAWEAMSLCSAAGDLACCRAKPLSSLSGYALCYAASALLF